MEEEPQRRSVDWDTLVGADFELKFERTLPAPRLLSSVLSAVDELSAYNDQDVLLRRAVELARDKLGMERVAIFLEDGSGERMLGTWGTGLRAETTDEHHFTYRRGVPDREVHEKAMTGAARWLVLSEAPLLAVSDDEPYIAGRSWVAATAIRSSNRALGVMYNDTAMTRRPLDEAQQTRLAVYCSLLGPLLERLQAPPEEAAELSPPSDLGPHVSGVVHALRRDPSLDARRLAEQAGVGEGYLNRLFRKTMGVSLVDYRNRLRIERFLCLVEAGQTNMHDAAEQAGFGSYAQFHRVFRASLGTTPREYLTGKRDDDGSPE